MRCFPFIKYLSILFSLHSIIDSVECSSYDVIVNTSSGALGGVVMQTRKGRDIFAFRGIRFAEPMLGERRFREAIPVKPWKGVMNATTDGFICPQPDPDFPQSEDCLFLNVFTRDLNKSLPVMVFIHGGSFYTGSGLEASPDYLLDKEILLVAINYRLGALGFLSTGTVDAPGNIGLKDQILALRWVRDHIKAFGGNPNLVTLLGHSAGSMSVNLHLVSPMSQGLFHRAIMMSGAITNHEQITTEYYSEKAAKVISCPEDDPYEMVECFRNTSWQEIIDQCEKINIKWGYVIEPEHSGERFMVENPTMAILRGDFAKVPIITGITHDEFAKPAFDIFSNITVRSHFNDYYDMFVPYAFSYDFEGEDREIYISSTLKKFYLNNQKLSANNLDGLEELFADAIIAHGEHRFVSLAREHTNVFYYRVNYIGRYSHFYKPDKTPHGVEHGDDLQYVIVYKPIAPVHKVTDPENPIIEKMTSWWVHFATTGNPNNINDPSTQDVVWKPCNESAVYTLNIDNKCDISEEPYRHRFALWDELFPINHPKDHNNHV